MNLWIVGIHKGELESGDIAWEFAGVYSSREAAERACIEWGYFVGPAVLDRALPTETIDWAGSYYPQAIAAADAAP